MINSKELFDINVSKSNVSVDDMIDKLLLNSDINEFVRSNDLSQVEVEQSVNVFIEYLSDLKTSKDGLKESKTLDGFVPVLSYDNKLVSLKYKRLVPLQKKDKYIKLYNLPEELKKATFEDFDLTTQERRKAYQYARRYVDTFKIPNPNKGLYLAGPFRSGKTYLASAIANEIASKGKRVIEVYYPELSIMLKGLISSNDESNSFIDAIEELKTTDLLILDDFGGEAINPFIRDEALGVILNHRMNNNLPTIITSNIMISKLADTSLRKDNSEQEKIKALRIVERIKELTEEFFFFEKYERKEKVEYYEN